MEDEDISAEKKAHLDEWEQANAQKEAKEQTQDTACGCFSTLINPTADDVWRGHVCTTDLKKFNSPLVRALLLKGHAYKQEQKDESLLRELIIGLDGYIQYKTKHDGDPADYEAWKQAILSRVRERLGRGDCTLYPHVDCGRKEIAELQKAPCVP